MQQNHFVFPSSSTLENIVKEKKQMKNDAVIIFSYNHLLYPLGYHLQVEKEQSYIALRNVYSFAEIITQLSQEERNKSLDAYFSMINEQRLFFSSSCIYPFQQMFVKNHAKYYGKEIQRLREHTNNVKKDGKFFLLMQYFTKPHQYLLKDIPLREEKDLSPDHKETLTSLFLLSFRNQLISPYLLRQAQELSSLVLLASQEKDITFFTPSKHQWQMLKYLKYPQYRTYVQMILQEGTLSLHLLQINEQGWFEKKIVKVTGKSQYFPPSHQEVWEQRLIPNLKFPTQSQIYQM